MQLTTPARKIVSLVTGHDYRAPRPDRYRNSLDSYQARLAACAVFSLLVDFLYYVYGYNHVLLAIWLVVMALIASTVSKYREKSRFNIHDIHLDVVAIALLLVAFFPVYVLLADVLPVQVNDDELWHINTARDFLSRNPDPFSISAYFAHPMMEFVVYGGLGKCFGGITFEHMRLVVGWIGLFTVATSYIFFRTMTASRWLASGATIVFGCSHALIGMSRMCTINSTPMIFETIALAFLFGGLKRRCPFLSFLGGMTAGAGMYFYFPSRGIPIIWLIFIGLLLVQPKRQIPRNVVVKLALATALGWFIVISPLLTAALRQPERLKDYMDYSQECSVLSLKGLMIHKDWVGAHSLVEAYTRNMVDALTIFNNGLMDHAWLYVNPNAGFVDALTGCLLWLGLAGMLLSKRRTRDNFVLAGFLTVYLGCALVLNKSPNYSRELIILPFSSFIVADFLLASDALLANFAGFSPRLPERSLKHSFFIGAIATIACLNIHITDDYFRAGLNRGDSVGSTGRYVMERRDKPGYQYFVAADTKQYPYFTHGGPDTWVGFISLFSNDGQSLPVTVILPMMCAKTTLRTPCTMFISRELFEQKGEELLQKYPGAIVHSVLPDGSRLGFELLKEKQIEMPKHRYSGRQMSASSASP